MTKSTSFPGGVVFSKSTSVRLKSFSLALVVQRRAPTTWIFRIAVILQDLARRRDALAQAFFPNGLRGRFVVVDRDFDPDHAEVALRRTGSYCRGQRRSRVAGL
ncbi:MAG: hypothetical protein QM811_12795 [Pirellulales bacterium]